MSDVGNVIWTGSGEMFSREFSWTQSLTALGMAGCEIQLSLVLSTGCSCTLSVWLLLGWI